MEGLRSLHIETHHIHNILKLNVHPSDTDYAVDIRNPAISVSHLHPGAAERPATITNTKILFSPRLKFTLVRPEFCRKVRALNLVSLFAPSGSTTWRRTASTAHGRTTCRSCCGPPSPESSGRSAKTSTIWCVQSPALGAACGLRELAASPNTVFVFVLQVIIMDPTQESTAELLSVAEMFYANNIPLRFVSLWMEFQFAVKE